MEVGFEPKFIAQRLRTSIRFKRFLTAPYNLMELGMAARLRVSYGSFGHFRCFSATGRGV